MTRIIIVIPNMTIHRCRVRNAANRETFEVGTAVDSILQTRIDASIDKIKEVVSAHGVVESGMKLDT